MHKIDVLWRAMTLKKVSELNKRAQASENGGDSITAEQLVSEALLLQELCFGPDSLELIEDLIKLGRINFELKRLERADECLSKALSIQQRELPASDPEIVETRIALAMVRAAAESAKAADEETPAVPSLNATLTANNVISHDFVSGQYLAGVR